jgi:RimJ/RimL family protein N-acetyltransferase
MMSSMQLKDEEIILSPFVSSDFELFFTVTNCPNTMKHVAKPFSYDEAKSAFEVRLQPWDLESDGWLSLCISDKRNGDKLGTIALKVINHEAKIAEIGFLLKSDAQGKGIGFRALKLITEYAFNELKLNKLVAFCSIKNEGSYKLLEKHNFMREGCLQQNTFVDNQYIDDYVYGLCYSSYFSD